jgi:MFS family permease
MNSSQSMQQSTFSESLALLRTRRFGTFFFASLLSNIGTWTQQVAEPWLLLSLGASPFLVGLDTFAISAPALLLTLVGGVLADHADRRRVIATFQSVQMLCPTFLVVLLLTGTVRPWIVIVLSLVVGITDALSMPSFQSILPSIVDRKQIPAGLALNSTQFNLSRILGPSLAGILMTSVGAVGCFVVNAASYIPFIFVALWILPKGQKKRPAGDIFASRHVFAGVRDIAGEPYLRGALLTVLVTSTLCAPLITFSPVIVRAVFHKDASLFGFAVGSFGLGALLGAIWLLSIDATRDRRRLSSGSGLGYGMILVLVALNPWFRALPVLLGFAGFSMSVSNTSANSLLQTTASPQLRGQTISLYMLAMSSGISLGSLLTGISVSSLGVSHALLINGSLAVVAHFFVGRKWLRLPQPSAVSI